MREDMGTEFGYETLEEKIEKFDVYKGCFTRFLLDYYWIFVPLYLIIGILLDIWILYPENLILNSSLTAILGAITIFILAFLSTRLSRKIPHTFKRVWDRNIISSKESENCIEDKIKFLDKFEKNLNSKIGVIWGVMWVIILLFGIVSTPYTPRFLADSNIIHWVVFSIFLLFFGFYLYIGGLILYKMYVTAKYIRKISREFDISIQILHPDKCGGLKPIGDLCLSNSFILIVMGIFFAIAIAIARGEEYSFAYGLFLLSVVVISILVFVLPVSYIHKIMLKEKIKKLEILDRVKEYEVLQEQYKKVEEFTTWPFDTSIWRKFIISEIVLIFTWVIEGLRWLGKEDKEFLTGSINILFGIS